MSDRMGARVVAIAVALVTLALVAANVAERYHDSTWILRDGRFYVNVNDGIIERGSLEDVYARSWYTGTHGWNYDLPASFSNIALGRDGEHYSFRPWLLPVSSTLLYFAFGLFGTLLFNVLMFAPIAFGAFYLGRRFAREASSAAIAALVLAFGTGLVFYQYDYHVDVLLVALLTSAFAAAAHRRGAVAGVLFALAVLIKPTTITLVPAACVLLAERRDRASVIRAIVGGAIVIGIGAVVNWYMFGKPWWFGYNRVLTVDAGVPIVASDVDAFTTPFETGIRDLWEGPWGLRSRWAPFLLAVVPGVPYLLVKRPLYAAVALATAAVNVSLFARFEYIGERYLLPTAVVLLPFVVAAFELTAVAFRHLRGVARGWPSRAVASALVAGLAAAMVATSALPSSRDAIEEIGRRAPYAVGAEALGAGSLDVRTVDPQPPTDDPATSTVTRSRFGHWLARSSPAAVAIAAPFAGALGGRGIVLLHVIAVFLAAFAAARILARAIDPAIAAAAVVGVTLLPVVREALGPGGPTLLATAAALFAAEQALARRWAVASVFGVLAAWIADAPWLVGCFVVGLAALDSRPALTRALAWTAGTLAVYCVVHLVLIGRPFASPDDFIVTTSGGLEEVVAIPREMPFGEFFRSVTTSVAQCAFERRDPAARGAILPLLWLGAVGAIAAAKHHRPLLALVLLLAASFLFPSARTPEAFLTLAIVAALPLAILMSRIATFAGRVVHLLESRRRIALAVLGVAIVALLAIGGVRRSAAADEPWRLASERSVRTAEVFLGDIPCDFLAWEHFAWECASFDGVTGLNTCSAPTIESAPRTLFVIPTSERRRAPRRVQWSGVPRGTLALEWGVPDDGVGGAVVTVRVDGAEVDRFDVPVDARGPLTTREIPIARDGATLEIEVASTGRRATIAFDGTIS